MHILPFVQQQHRAQITNALVREPRIRRQLEALELRKMRRIAEHMDVQQLGDVATAPQRVLLAERGANVGRFLVDDGPFLGGSARCSNLTDEVAQPCGRRHANWVRKISLP